MAQTGLAVGVEGARLLDNTPGRAYLQKVAHPADALIEHNVELGDPEGSGDLVLHYPSPHAVADDFGTLLYGFNAAQVYANRAVELEGPATGSDLWAAVGDAHFFPKLVDENHRRLGLVDGPSELAESLGHKAGLEADVGVAHVAFDFRLGHEGGHAVDHDGVYGSATHQLLGDVQRLLGAVGLGNQQFVQVQAAVASVHWVKGVLDVYVCCDATSLLRLGHQVDGEGGLTCRLRAEDLGYPPAGNPSGPQCQINSKRTR